MNGGRGVVRNLIGKSDHKAEHEWVNDTCKWCAMGKGWPGAKGRCRGGANANQAAVNERKRIAKGVAVQEDR